MVSPGAVEMIPGTDSTIAARLRAAGAIIVGKTSINDFALTGNNATSTLNGQGRQRLRPDAHSRRLQRRLRHRRQRGLRRDPPTAEETGSSITNPASAGLDRRPEAHVRHRAQHRRLPRWRATSATTTAASARASADAARMIGRHGRPELHRPETESCRRQHPARRLREIHRRPPERARRQGDRRAEPRRPGASATRTSPTRRPARCSTASSTTSAPAARRSSTTRSSTPSGSR